MNRLFRAAAFFLAGAFALAASVSTTRAQAPAAAPGDSNGPVKLLPGLDKDLMDQSTGPCDNFVQYACGNFSKLYPIPADKPALDTMYMVYDYTQTVLHKLLNTVAEKSAQHTPNEQKIGDYYATCLDAGSYSRQRSRPESAAVRQSLRVQGGPADDAGKCLPRLVNEALFK